MRISADSSLRAVAFIVCTALDRAGLTAVLTGGGAATVYAPSAYQSRDLDFVLQFRGSTSEGPRALSLLGYRLSGNVYVHEESELTLDFPPGPLMVGGDVLGRWDTLREDELLLHIIDPTDSCRDRLAGFVFWNDRGSLHQALAVASSERTRVDLERIRDWCRREGKKEGFHEFERRLRAAS